MCIRDRIANKQTQVLKEKAAKHLLKREYLNLDTIYIQWEPTMEISKKAQMFEYLGESLTLNINGKATIEEMAVNMKQAIDYAGRLTIPNHYDARPNSNTTVQ